MESANPKVCVIVPAYNSAAYTLETVESILAQTYSNFELIVVDDGSTDHTQEALKPYLDRIRYIYKENGGACSARNLGIRESKSTYVACLDCDDLWLPEKLEYSVKALEENPQAAFVFGDCYTIDPEGKQVGLLKYDFDLQNAYKGLMVKNFVPAPTVVMRRSCLEQVELFDEQIFIPADWDLWLRLAKQFPICYVDKALSQYRFASNYTLRHIEKSLNENLYVLKKLFQDKTLTRQDRRLSQWNTLFTHSMMYRNISDLKNARRVLRMTIKRCPLMWRAYVHFFLSLFGTTGWNGVSKLKGLVKPQPNSGNVYSR